MAHRSTRNKIRFQMVKAVANLDRVLENLRYIDQIADGSSPHLNENIPKLVAIVDGIRDMMLDFRNTL